MWMFAFWNRYLSFMKSYLNSVILVCINTMRWQAFVFSTLFIFASEIVYTEWFYLDKVVKYNYNNCFSAAWSELSVSGSFLALEIA